MFSIQNLQAFFQDNLPFYLDILRQMVDINSFTSNAQGVNQLGDLTANFFSRLGFKSEPVQSKHPLCGRHLFLSHPGSLGGSSYTIALISHLDTVFSPEEERQNDFRYRIEGDRIYGPGTVDIKGGTLMIYMVLEAIHTFARQTFDSISWLIGIDPSEEALSDDFGDYLKERLPPTTLACLVFEGGTPSNNSFPIVVARKGRATFRVKAWGRSAHAGNDHARGANAIIQISHTVQKIASFTDYAQDLTFNVGTVHGGSVVNRVPHFAEADVEMRAFAPDVFQNGYSRIMDLSSTSQVASADGFQCKVSVQPIHQTAPWPRNHQTDRLYDIWQAAAEVLGLHTIPEERGGLSDGNLLWSHFPTLDGLGPTGANAHCSERSPDRDKDQEYVLIPSIIPKALLNTFSILNLVEVNTQS